MSQQEIEREERNRLAPTRAQWQKPEYGKISAGVAEAAGDTRVDSMGNS